MPSWMVSARTGSTVVPYAASANNIARASVLRVFMDDLIYSLNVAGGSSVGYERTAPMHTSERADIGVFGGSGFYSLMENAREVAIDTPFGAPSDRVAL